MVLSLASLPPTVRKAAQRGSPQLQAKFQARLHCMQQLASAPKSRWEAVAVRLSQEMTPRHGRGFSAKSILNLWRAFREEGPEALVFGYGSESEQPAEFVEELARRAGNNKRVSSKALETLHADWRAGKPIPGYGTWADHWVLTMSPEPVPAFCPEWFIPEGWSPRNLRRALPGAAALGLARDGYFATHSKLPQVRFDWRGLRPLEGIAFDDVKPDWLVAVPGYREACELWLLVAMDAATRVILDWVSLVVVPNAETGRKESLLEEHMQMLAGQVLLKYGVPVGYTSTWTIENAKATLRPHLRQLLSTISGGAIHVETTRMVDRALPGGFSERHGMPWDGPKKLLESFFRSFHDAAGALPGQTGSVQMLNAPAELEARQKEHSALMRECEGLPTEVIAQLRSTFLTQAEAIATVDQLFAKLNARTEHRLEGFERVQVWRFPEDLQWRPLDELRRYPSTEVRRAIFDTRLESPIARFERLARELAPTLRVPEDALIPFLAKTVRKVRHPAPYTLEWSEGNTRWTYRGELPELATGEGGPFVVKVLPHNIAVAHVYTEDDRYLGAVARVHAPNPYDRPAVERALGEVQHYRKLVVQPVMDRHAPDRAAEDERRQRNAALIQAARTGRAMLDQGEQAAQISAADRRATARRRAQLEAELADAAREVSRTDSEAPQGGLYDDSESP